MHLAHILVLIYKLFLLHSLCALLLITQLILFYYHRVETIVNYGVTVSSSISRWRVFSDHRPALYTMPVVLRNQIRLIAISCFALFFTPPPAAVSADVSKFRIPATRSTKGSHKEVYSLAKHDPLNTDRSTIDSLAQIVLSMTQLVPIIHVPWTRCK